jgi:hypothetical protein
LICSQPLECEKIPSASRTASDTRPNGLGKEYQKAGAPEEVDPGRSWKASLKAKLGIASAGTWISQGLSRPAQWKDT